MKRTGRRFRRVLIPLVLGVVSVAGVSAGVPSTAQAEEGKIDVTITDKGYTVEGLHDAWGRDEDCPSQQGDDDASDSAHGS